MNHPDISRSESTETIQVLMPSNEPYTPACERVPESATTWSSKSTKSIDDRSVPAQPQPLYASSSRYPSDFPVMDTPTRPPMGPFVRQMHPDRSVGSASRNDSAGPPKFAFLDSPYSPTGPNYVQALNMGSPVMQTGDRRRDTTFSAMMERAGLRKSELLVGGRNGGTRLKG